jgi:hypothetical protein
MQFSGKGNWWSSKLWLLPTLTEQCEMKCAWKIVTCESHQHNEITVAAGSIAQEESITLKDWTWLITCHVQRLIVDWILVSGSSLCSEMNNTPAFNTDPWCLQALLCCFQMLKLLIHLQSPKVDIKTTHKLAYTKNSALQEDLILMSLWYGELSDQNHT